jgi:exopolysaccharide production protein ExoQ
MSSTLALFATFAFIAFLFARDIRGNPNVTRALWLPFLWVVIGPGTRFLSQWLDILGFHVGGITVEDGSPLDAAYYSALIACGAYVLYKRRVNFPEFLRNNRWVTIYLVYCLLAVLWSDYPFVALKRWIKLLGDPVMALVILTEPDLLEALVTLIKRAAFVMLPLSICFIKYFPNLGRTFDFWSGAPCNTGITTNKNLLGFDLWILGTVLFWHFLQVWAWKRGRARRNELVLCGGLLGMDLCLFKMAQSETSLMAFLLGTIIMLFLGFRRINVRQVGAYVIVGIAFCAIAGYGLGLYGDLLHLLGRNDTLTGRTDIWRMLWHWDINPILGTGFESFWLGERRLEVQNYLPFLNEAHNGYLETYLNLGIFGVAITAAMLLATYAKARRELFNDFEFGRLRMCFLFAFIVYNWTEAAFRLNDFPFFMFFIIAIDYPALEPRTVMVDEENVLSMEKIVLEPAFAKNCSC